MIKPEDIHVKISYLPPLMEEGNRFSPLYPLEPRGSGTGQIECITGYAMRLADMHWMKTTAFFNHALFQGSIGKNQKKYTVSRDVLYSANGYGVFADRICTRITQLTRGVQASTMSFLHWKDVFDPRGHGLFASELKWCTHCWKQDEADGETPYIRLAWLTHLIRVCPHHNHELENICPFCSKPQPLTPIIPRPWICNSCGRVLHHTRKGKMLPKDEREKELWIARSIERLIERTSAQNISLPHRGIFSALHEIIDNYSEGSVALFSNQTGIAPQYINKWYSENTRLAFSSFIDLCYRIDIPPDVFLMDKQILTHPDNWRRTPRTHFVKMEKLKDNKKNAIKQLLLKYINENPEIPPLITEIATEAGVTYTLLNYHYPRLVYILKKRSDEYRKSLKIAVDRNRIHRLERSVKKLVEKGIYPSQRQLKYLGHVKPSDLRRPEILEKLKHMQKDYKCVDG